MSTALQKKLYKSLDPYFEESTKASHTLEFNEKEPAYKPDIFNQPLHMVQLAQVGVPWNTFDKLSRKLNFSDQEWSKILDLSTKSLQRYRTAKTSFRPMQSEKILEIVRIMTIGKKVFPDIEKFSTWLRIPSIPLGGYKPIELLNVSYGQQLVYHELGHILYGIFA